LKRLRQPAIAAPRGLRKAPPCPPYPTRCKTPARQQRTKRIRGCGYNYRPALACLPAKKGADIDPTAGKGEVLLHDPWRFFQYTSCGYSYQVSARAITAEGIRCGYLPSGGQPRSCTTIGARHRWQTRRLIAR